MPVIDSPPTGLAMSSVGIDSGANGEAEEQPEDEQPVEGQDAEEPGVDE